MSRYKVAPSALADLDEIWFYIAQKTNPEIAERVLDSITRAFSLLAANPKMDAIAPILVRPRVAFPLPTTESTIGRIAAAAFAFCTSSTRPVTRTSYSNSL
jgi:ParE toxin of type II toxin-antitoxin system, parDE